MLPVAALARHHEGRVTYYDGDANPSSDGVDELRQGKVNQPPGEEHEENFEYQGYNEGYFDYTCGCVRFRGHFRQLEFRIVIIYFVVFSFSMACWCD